MSCIYSCKALPGRIRAVPQVGAIAPRHRHRRLSGCRFSLPCRILDTKGVEALSSARQFEAPGASSAPAWNQRSAKVHALLRADANRPRRRRRLGTDETEARRDADPRAGAGASVGDRQFSYNVCGSQLRYLRLGCAHLIIGFIPAPVGMNVQAVREQVAIKAPTSISYHRDAHCLYIGQRQQIVMFREASSVMHCVVHS